MQQILEDLENPDVRKRLAKEFADSIKEDKEERQRRADRARIPVLSPVTRAVRNRAT